MTGWVDHAACRPHPTSWWYQRHDALETELALSICRTCPVRAACLDEALDAETDHRYGIVGGTTPSDRDRLELQRRRLAGTTTAVAAGM
jgi:WhiB family redox-sensing transcriptional regulator